MNALGNGMVGGVMSVLQGGKFGHGFAAAGLTVAVAPGVSGIAGASSASLPLKVLMGAVAGGTISKLTGGKFANGARTAAFVGLMSAASEYYEGAVGRRANPLPGKNKKGKTIYNPAPYKGRQAPGDEGMNVIGHNEKLTDDWLRDFGKQGSDISKVLNLVPGMNAIAGLHDYWLNPGNPSQLPKTLINNVGTMPLATVISVFSLMGNYTVGNESMIMTRYHLDRQKRRRSSDD